MNTQPAYLLQAGVLPLLRHLVSGVPGKKNKRRLVPAAYTRGEEEEGGHAFRVVNDVRGWEQGGGASGG